MQLKALHFQGHFQEQPERMAEELQIVTPESGVDRQMLSWAILHQPETIGDDQARQGYSFRYELGEVDENGLAVLGITARDASGQEHAAEVTAALVSVIATLDDHRSMSFVPFWLLSKELHLQLQEGADYPGAAFGHLRFGDPAVLPHRRLFGATV